MNKKVMVAMSGGVDSSAAALLLQQQGYDICGVTLSLYSNDDILQTSEEKTCCSLDDVEDARRVCTKLGVDHFVFNMKQQFREKVIDTFANSYKIGETPNPCIECNRHIKFSGVLNRAEQLGFDMIATGHYVISEYDPAAERWILRRAVDPNKDQSYVLYVLTQDMLSKTLFPLGGLNKSQIREIAEQHELINARKRESQDICFVPDGDYAAFLIKKLGVKTKNGKFVDTEGKTLGEHKGIIRYTIGQRRGLGVSADRRLFVIDKNIKENKIILGDEPLLFKNRMWVRDVNWVSIKPPNGKVLAQVKSRYRQNAQSAVLHPMENGVLVEFEQPQRALTTGQAAVFYDGDVVLGGGTISPFEE